MPHVNASLLCGGLSSFLAIVFGAWADHALKLNLPPVAYESLQTALRYPLLHAVLLACIGMALTAGAPARMARRLRLASLFFVAGTLLFCGGIFIAKTGLFEQALQAGGVAFMLGWLSLLESAFAERRT